MLFKIFLIIKCKIMWNELCYVYVVTCKMKNSKSIGYYVGTWGGDHVVTRWRMHSSGVGSSQFCLRNQPIAFKCVGRFPRKFARMFEDRLSEYYIQKVGFRKARGGRYNNMRKDCYLLENLKWWLPKSCGQLLLQGKLGRWDLPSDLIA
jgi:hypothetical protein